MANTIADKLTYLSDTKDAIKQAITGKGVDVSDTDTFRSYADKISSIQTGGSLAGAPSGIRFSNSTFTTVPTEIIPYLEQQADLSHIFEYCRSLTTVPLFDTSKATGMNNMFNGCGSLQKVSQLDTSSVTNMGYMFNNCSKLTTVPHFVTSRVNNMGYMFGNCSKLTTVPHFVTSRVDNMGYMFSNCTSLISVSLFDTSKCTNMYMMFSGCSSLQTVSLLDTSNVDSMAAIFNRCTSLTNLGGFTGLKLSLNLSSSPLTVDSVMNVINNAADMTSSPRTLTLRRDAFDKLSQEQIATANAKGWNIAVE